MMNYATHDQAILCVSCGAKLRPKPVQKRTLRIDGQPVLVVEDLEGAPVDQCLAPPQLPRCSRMSSVIAGRSTGLTVDGARLTPVLQNFVILTNGGPPGCGRLLVPGRTSARPLAPTSTGQSEEEGSGAGQEPLASTVDASRLKLRIEARPRDDDGPALIPLAVRVVQGDRAWQSLVHMPTRGGDVIITTPLDADRDAWAVVTDWPLGALGLEAWLPVGSPLPRLMMASPAQVPVLASLAGRWVEKPEDALAGLPAANRPDLATFARLNQLPIESGRAIAIPGGRLFAPVRLAAGSSPLTIVLGPRFPRLARLARAARELAKRVERSEAEALRPTLLERLQLARVCHEIATEQGRSRVDGVFAEGTDADGVVVFRHDELLDEHERTLRDLIPGLIDGLWMVRRAFGGDPNFDEIQDEYDRYASVSPDFLGLLDLDAASPGSGPLLRLRLIRTLANPAVVAIHEAESALKRAIAAVELMASSGRRVEGFSDSDRASFGEWLVRFAEAVSFASPPSASASAGVNRASFRAPMGGALIVPIIKALAGIGEALQKEIATIGGRVDVSIDVVVNRLVPPDDLRRLLRRIDGWLIEVETAVSGRGEFQARWLLASLDDGVVSSRTVKAQANLPAIARQRLPQALRNALLVPLAITLWTRRQLAQGGGNPWRRDGGDREPVKPDEWVALIKGIVDAGEFVTRRVIAGQVAEGAVGDLKVLQAATRIQWLRVGLKASGKLLAGLDFLLSAKDIVEEWGEGNRVRAWLVAGSALVVFAPHMGVVIVGTIVFGILLAATSRPEPLKKLFKLLRNSDFGEIGALPGRPPSIRPAPNLGPFDESFPLVPDRAALAGWRHHYYLDDAAATAIKTQPADVWTYLALMPWRLAIGSIDRGRDAISPALIVAHTPRVGPRCPARASPTPRGQLPGATRSSQYQCHVATGFRRSDAPDRRIETRRDDLPTSPTPALVLSRRVPFAVRASSDRLDAWRTRPRRSGLAAVLPRDPMPGRDRLARGRRRGSPLAARRHPLRGRRQSLHRVRPGQLRRLVHRTLLESARGPALLLPGRSRLFTALGHPRCARRPITQGGRTGDLKGRGSAAGPVPPEPEVARRRCHHHRIAAPLNFSDQDGRRS